MKAMAIMLAAILAGAATPAQARFLQTDPIGYKDDLNWYEYVRDDPTNKTDPTGLKCDRDSVGKVTSCSFDEIKGGGAPTQQMNDYMAAQTAAVTKLQSHPNDPVTITVGGKSMTITAGEAAENIMDRYTVADPSDHRAHGGHTDLVEGKVVSTITARGLAGEPGKGTPIAPKTLLGADQPGLTKLWNREISAVHELGFHGSTAEKDAFGTIPQLKQLDGFNADHQREYNENAERLLGLPVNPANE